MPGRIQSQSACLPPLRAAPSAQQFTGGQPVGPCVSFGAEAVSDLPQESTSLFSEYAPYLARTGMRDLIHLWKFRNRPQLTQLLAELSPSRLRTDVTKLLTAPTAAAHTVLVPIPTQWSRQTRRRFDHTWLLANAIRSQSLQSAVVRPWLLNRHYRAAQHRLNKKSRLADTQDRFVVRPSIAATKLCLLTMS